MVHRQKPSVEGSGEPRTLELALDFLPKGQTFEAHIYQDDARVPSRTKVGIERKKVNAKTILKASMSHQGGVAVRFHPVK